MPKKILYLVGKICIILSVTFYKDIGFFWGLKDTPAPTLKILRGLAPQSPRFLSLCNFITLAWVQESVFHIAAGSHPVQEVWGSQDHSSC